MELGVSHVQHLSSLTPVVDNIFNKYNNKNLVPIRSLSDHDIYKNVFDRKPTASFGIKIQKLTLPLWNDLDFEMNLTLMTVS